MLSPTPRRGPTRACPYRTSDCTPIWANKLTKQLWRLIVNNHINRFRVKGLVLVLVVTAVALYVAFDRAPTTAAKQATPGGPFIEFESGQVRPVALSPNGSRLFAVNTPNN